MSQSLSKVYVHITFSTKRRYPFIDENIKEELWAYIGGICKSLECNPIRIGGFHDHIHICCVLSRTITQAKLLEDVKKISSQWIKTKGKQYEKFYWQNGYGIFSVNPTEIGRVVKYIDNQFEHHKKHTFQNELVGFLNKYDMEYDERYLWD
jgi:REP element-mobilizing transposase RayT